MVVLGLVGWNTAAVGANAKYTMKLGHATANDAQDAVANFFANEVEKLSGGQIKAMVYNASQLGNNIKMNKDLRSGVQEAIVQPAGFSARYIKILSVLDLPFLFPSEAVQNKVLNTAASDPIREDARKAGVEIVAFYPAGSIQFATKFPINAAADLKGRKFRIIPSPVITARFKAMGAIGVPMPLGELYPALQQGTVEGCEITFEIIERMKFYEVANYVTESNHAMFAGIILVNKRWLDALPADLQKALYQAGTSLTEEVLNIRNNFVQKSVAVLKKDAKFSVLPEAERAQLKASCEIVWTNMKKDPQKAALIDALIKGVAAQTK
jgi:tripartite ATP-independent transporter DctP family solute receptor